MVFARDTRQSLAAAVDLVNTLPATDVDGLDGLRTPADLEAFIAERPYTGSFARDDAELEAVRALRPRLRELWLADRETAVPLVNAMLRDGAALPQLVIHEGLDWHIHATGDDAPLATRILVETAMAFVDVIRADAYERIRVCAADDCLSVYVDYSKNGSKRYCDTGNCGNRMNVIAYRRRKAAETP
ncbi:CGNR zinc finger domain-containing protein [Microbacterium sp. zg.Y1090]|uniref:CGNR zinc finger domain-containing protein n=1 Tax=Microbacterium TaxID=33882 RepID=UPI00214B8C2D|nr:MULTISPECIES: CGNR zinc finger domain-containing protein [unclassified Microbacterium]MCR2811986.1 CGNR zinc finger domain-containing protein [Microbacterium sp. zg.Y1084]MCR2818575.1 CGNR zinc finger domain-containing protein [Microbacterium sp. zg.Y1090]MDL5486388.1 CGNR zinc finger domain-containing protein [Microbacterium sp. zg-Y1211]WIM29717.1 CGNR zinc finger domain-containing protein [Microbacterium sp. zg-Y1090]